MKSSRKLKDVPQRVVHLVPMDGLGGVEAAVRSLRPEEHEELAVFYMARSAIRNDPDTLFRTLSPTRSLNSPVVFWVALREVLRAHPEVLICSLWRATIVGLAAKILRPKLRLVVMIHATTIAHLPDRVVTTLGASVATEIWCDSEASKQVAQKRFGRTARSISFLVNTILPPQNGPRRALDFVFWGRHVHFKNVPRAVRLFNRILMLRPEARLFIYGQEGPATEDVRKAVAESSRPDAIRLMGAKPPGEYPDPIPSCTFFLMTSRQEGMAIAVVEAMQLGLIPVVTAVGEIANYCAHGENAVVITNDDQAALEVIRIASDPELQVAMRAAALQCWRDTVDYSTDFKNAYRSLLSIP